MGRSTWIWLPLFTSFVVLSGARPPAAFSSSSLDSKARRWVESTFRQMSLEEKTGQLIIAGTRTGFTRVNTETLAQIEESIKRYHVGAYHAFGGEVASAAYLIARIQRAAKIPLLITSDLEGGAGLVFEGATRFPKAMALGAAARPELVAQVARITALEARAIGIHLNFYPVVDVNNNMENPIINIRSFGENPAQVGKMAATYIRSAQENGLLATAKHFPGHGDTSLDSHLELPVLNLQMSRLLRVELPPFREAIQAQVGAVMAAHLSVPALDPQGLPASLSRPILSDLLRKRLGFDGLIVTDALNMKGITDQYRDGEAAVRAVQAGADLVLFPSSISQTFDGLYRAVQSGRISEKRLNRSVKRILETKARAGLHLAEPANLETLESVVGTASHEQASQEIMDQAVTLIRDDGNLLPLKLDDAEPVLLLTLLEERRPGNRRGLKFLQELAARHPRLHHLEIDSRGTAEQLSALSLAMEQAQAVITMVFLRGAAYKGSIRLPEPLKEAIYTVLSSRHKPAVVILLGSPYVLSDKAGPCSLVLTFDDHPAAEVSALKAILGDIPFRGRLPVSLAGGFSMGYGIHK